MDEVSPTVTAIELAPLIAPDVAGAQIAVAW
jgi:hypothetical protein